MDTPNHQPFIVLTVVLDSSARSAAVTRSHGDALERAMKASQGKDIAGFDIVELPILPKAFAGLKAHLKRDEGTVGVYDVFPLAPHLDADVRRIAGQFLAAEALWTLEEQGLLGGVPLNVRLDIPKDWDRNPKAVHAKLIDARALDLSPDAIETFNQVKATWEALGAQS